MMHIFSTLVAFLLITPTLAIGGDVLSFENKKSLEKSIGRCDKLLGTSLTAEEKPLSRRELPILDDSGGEVLFESANNFLDTGKSTNMKISANGQFLAVQPDPFNWESLKLIDLQNQQDIKNIKLPRELDSGFIIGGVSPDGDLVALYPKSDSMKSFYIIETAHGRVILSGGNEGPPELHFFSEGFVVTYPNKILVYDRIGNLIRHQPVTDARVSCPLGLCGANASYFATYIPSQGDIIQTFQGPQPVRHRESGDILVFEDGRGGYEAQRHLEDAVKSESLLDGLGAHSYKELSASVAENGELTIQGRSEGNGARLDYKSVLDIFDRNGKIIASISPFYSSGKTAISDDGDFFVVTELFDSPVPDNLKKKRAFIYQTKSPQTPIAKIENLDLFDIAQVHFGNSNDFLYFVSLNSGKVLRVVLTGP